MQAPARPFRCRHRSHPHLFQHRLDQHARSGRLDFLRESPGSTPGEICFAGDHHLPYSESSGYARAKGGRQVAASVAVGQSTSLAYATLSSKTSSKQGVRSRMFAPSWRTIYLLIFDKWDDWARRCADALVSPHADDRLGGPIVPCSMPYFDLSTWPLGAFSRTSVIRTVPHYFVVDVARVRPGACAVDLLRLVIGFKCELLVCS